MKRIIIGSRGSQLALTQTRFVLDKLQACLPEYEIIIHQIKTQGDKLQEGSLSKIEKGLFVKEIEASLLGYEIDLAVHSMKDVPTEVPRGLSIAAITRRLTPYDALISRDELGIADLASGARIATSSVRRRAQLLHYRRDIEVKDLRGNLDTRLRKLQEKEFDAIIIAACGLIRLGWQDRITQILPSDIVMPAVGQGSLAIEVREDDTRMHSIVDSLNDPESFMAITAERAFLKELGGGCQSPIAALAVIEDGLLRLEGIIGSINGSQLFRGQIQGQTSQAQELGKRLADQLMPTCVF